MPADESSGSLPSHVDAASAPAEAARRGAFRLLFGCMVCVGMGHSIVFSILPPLSRELGISEFKVGTVFSVSALLWVIFSPVWGRASDRWGRRPVILAGLLGFAISTLAFTLSIHAGLAGLVSAAAVYLLLVCSRSIFGGVSAGIFPAAQAYVADRTSARERGAGIAMVGGAMGLGHAIGPGLGAALVVFGLLAPLYVVAVIAVLSAAAIWRWLPEATLPRRGPQLAPLRTFDPRLRPYLLIGFALSTVQAILMQTIGFYFMDSLQLEAQAAVTLAGVGLMAFALTSLCAQLVLIRRFSPSPGTLLRAGAGLCVLSNLLLVIAPSLTGLVAAMAIAGLGIGLLRPGNLTAASLAVGHDEQGAAAGVVGGTGAAGYIFAPVFGTGFYQWQPIGPYLLGAAVMIAVLALVCLHPRLRRTARPPGACA